MLFLTIENECALELVEHKQVQEVGKYSNNMC